MIPPIITTIMNLTLEDPLMVNSNLLKRSSLTTPLVLYCL
jgi:hypothetical protein